MKRKVMTVVGTRPELIKMSRVIDKLDRAFDHVLVHTGQNHDDALARIFFEDLEIRAPDHHLAVAGGNAMTTVARVIEGVDALLEAERPEALVVYGDTNSGLCVLAAKRRRIPVFHLEAGNRCFDDRVPEELNRRVIDHASDVNLVLTEHARRHLLAEGLPADRIYKLGSHMPEVLAHQRERIAASDVLERLGLVPDRFFVASLHREENVDDPARLRHLIDGLLALADSHGMPVIVSTHPRTRARLAVAGRDLAHGPIRFLPPFSFSDYIRLQQAAFCVISDSGTITEEASLLGLPAVSVRDSHERPEGVDAGVLVFCDARADRLVEAVRIVRDGFSRAAADRRPVSDYEAGAVSDAVVRIVASLIDAVNERTWRRPRI
ncbi:non-hydrolyzing UDP-N-acetylglucosamine 2-epimerase [Hydrogenophaga electricum]|uniref:UDP-N-acetyl glucosamine 2-epimerase n=1 Tax=Hydrogenophaga electricum TaxID=1230953 RepID=A0ABQ6C8N6_9BURK|nr:UDP-N-acetylglucosamine 2-epimerase (non-hydrolyzing) [Hydrogenophaga electricum]GLS16057.1 UDP-N-acetyl glucosamine 2-epimerase [Hydrogenophaga electricum]